MIERVDSWWRGLSRRERWLVGIAGSLAGAIAGWFLILTPLSSAVDAAVVAHGAALERQAAVNSRIAALRRGGTAPRSSAPAAITATSIAAEIGLPLARNDPAGDTGTAIAVSAARAPAALALVQRLAAAGLQPSDLAIRRNPDGTVALTATLRRSGS
jgi:general secretion pathway protein M